MMKTHVWFLSEHRQKAQKAEKESYGNWREGVPNTMNYKISDSYFLAYDFVLSSSKDNL